MRQPRQSKALIRVEDERGEVPAPPSGSAYPAGSRIKVETGHYRASIATAGYVTGVAAGSFVDTKTGAHDLGFGLSIVDFLLEPADPKPAIPAGQYTFGPGDKVHGNIVDLSYHEPSIITSTEFVADFAPDERFLYRRGDRRLPERFIRAYQVTLPGGDDGPWLAGMSLNPEDVYQAWCHQRGYVCLIEEIGGRRTRPGDTFGACYLIGWFDDLNSMLRTHDRFRGWSGLALEGTAVKPTAYRGLKRRELTAVPMNDGALPGVGRNRGRHDGRTAIQREIRQGLP
jgi:hypothetical protein